MTRSKIRSQNGDLDILPMFLGLGRCPLACRFPQGPRSWMDALVDMGASENGGGGTLFWVRYSKDLTISGTILVSLIFGNSHMACSRILLSSGLSHLVAARHIAEEKTCPAGGGWCVETAWSAA